MGFLDTILSTIFPEKCLGCGQRGVSFCKKCLESCSVALRESARWIFPCYDYRHPYIKKSLWLFKYKGRRRLASVFADALYDKMLEELSDLSTMENFHNPLLVPIPLSRKRLRERGYNQAELVCAEILKINDSRQGLKMKLETKILSKSKDTEHQARIKDRRKRIENMRGTFMVTDQKSVRGKNIILVDDILTTGATLSDARRALRAAGARKVIAFTIAH